MTEHPTIQGLNIILLGDFNPKIFQPAWFGAQNLIRPSEAEAAKIEIVNPEISIFSVDWLQIQITRDRCTFATIQEAYYEPLYDLCLSTFKLLKHTPIRIIGINRWAHYPKRTLEEWHTIGHKLAPKDLWNTILQEPGMQSLTIQAKREDKYKGYIRVTVEPSAKIPIGVFINVNDHYIADEPVEGCEKIIDILEASFGQSMKKANEIMQAVLYW
jgi:hypothetical protein